MTTAHALQTPSTPRNLCSMDAAPILATMPKPVPAKPRAPQQAPVVDLFNGDTRLSGKSGRAHADRLRQYESSRSPGECRRLRSGKCLLGPWSDGRASATGISVELLSVSTQTGQQPAPRRLWLGSIEGDKLTQADREVSAATGHSARTLSRVAAFGTFNGSLRASTLRQCRPGSVRAAPTSARSVGSSGRLTAGGGIGVGGEVGVGLRPRQRR